MVKKCKDNPFSKNYLEVLKWSNNLKKLYYKSKHTIFIENYNDKTYLAI